MTDTVTKRWRIFWVACCLVFVAAMYAYGTMVRLYATVTYSLLNHLSNAPLADGSMVYIMGSSNDVADSPPTISGGLVAHGVTNDDTYIGHVRIGDGVSSNGTFFTSNYEFDSDQVKYVYLRFFETNPPGQYIDGTGIWWNTSPTFSATNFNPWAPQVNVDFIGNYAATNRNDFVVIPEPGTGILVVLCGGLLMAVRAGRRSGDPPKPENKAPPENTPW